MELGLNFLLNHSSLLRGNLLGVIRNYYMQNDRKIIQYLSECAKYDNDLAYTLKPGKCHIKNREFEVQYSINSIGVRDSESSLFSPEIIVAGDSQAMGWGVKQDLTFSSLLEVKLGKSVLNAGVSSYGTVRELKILERVNLDNLKYLIIQYCDNDFQENLTFSKNGNIIPIMSETMYESLKEKSQTSATYYFGKHSIYLIKVLIREVQKFMTSSSKVTNVFNNAENSTAEEVKVFLNAILNSTINLNDVVIIVFEVNSFSRNDSLFLDKLNKILISEQANHPLIKNIKTVDLSLILGGEQYFHLDDHINRKGHHAISESIGNLILGMRNNRVKKNHI